MIIVSSFLPSCHMPCLSTVSNMLPFTCEIHHFPRCSTIVQLYCPRWNQILTVCNFFSTCCHVTSLIDNWADVFSVRAREVKLLTVPESSHIPSMPGSCCQAARFHAVSDGVTLRDVQTVYCSDKSHLYRLFLEGWVVQRRRNTPGWSTVNYNYHRVC